MADRQPNLLINLLRNENYEDKKWTTNKEFYWYMVVYFDLFGLITIVYSINNFVLLIQTNPLKITSGDTPLE